jgi:hypothetical protein
MMIEIKVALTLVGYLYAESEQVTHKIKSLGIV